VQDWEERLGQPEGPEEIRLERAPHSPGPPALAVDPGVVDERVETDRVAAQPHHEVRDRLGARHVERDERHAAPRLCPQAGGDRLALLRIAPGEQDVPPGPGELATHLGADPPVPTRDAGRLLHVPRDASSRPRPRRSAARVVAWARFTDDAAIACSNGTAQNTPSRLAPSHPGEPNVRYPEPADSPSRNRSGGT